jgi:hypothetical protein
MRTNSLMQALGPFCILNLIDFFKNEEIQFLN